MFLGASHQNYLLVTNFRHKPNDLSSEITNNRVSAIALRRLRGVYRRKTDSGFTAGGSSVILRRATWNRLLPHLNAYDSALLKSTCVRASCEKRAAESACRNNPAKFWLRYSSIPARLLPGKSFARDCGQKIRSWILIAALTPQS